MSEKASLYTRMIRAGRRTYFFDVREARNNKRFMIIAESTRSGRHIQPLVSNHLS